MGDLMSRTLLLAGALALVLTFLAPALPVLANLAEPPLHAAVEIPIGEVILWLGGLVVAVAAVGFVAVGGFVKRQLQPVVGEELAAKAAAVVVAGLEKAADYALADLGGRIGDRKLTIDSAPVAAAAAYARRHFPDALDFLDKDERKVREMVIPRLVARQRAERIGLVELADLPQPLVEVER
ncbi:hypothetical protein ATO13_08471 [Stappia sp. 22II-S9-Z10]|nr:hypothetical protein ATO13_08471 [Stappia sp. 22II-S9-Z10]